MPKIEVTRFGDAQALVRISGVIDESFDPASLSRVASRGVLVIDLDGVTRITSFGVRQWLNALADLHVGYYCFIRCRPPIVWQFNLIESFGGRGELVSLYVPYVCAVCKVDIAQLIDLRHSVPTAARALSGVVCSACGGTELEIDDTAALYFDYVRTTPPPRLPLAAEEIIGGRAPEPGSRFRIQKTVSSELTALAMSGALEDTGWFLRLADGLQGDVVIIAADVVAISVVGVDALRRLLHTEGCRFFLARVPRPLWPLVAELGDCPEARVISVVVPFRCPTCGRQPQAPVNRAGIEHLDSGGQIACTGCGTALAPDHDPSCLAEALALPFAEPPDHVVSYLVTEAATGPVPITGRTHLLRGPLADPALAGKYELVESLGAGGMGQVFLARKLGIGGFDKPVVIKVVHGRFAHSPHYIAMFLNEARLAAKLSHSNIVQIFDVGVARGQYYSVMEYVAGADLGKLLRISRHLSRPFPLALSCTIAMEVADALTAAHTATDDAGHLTPIIHRDVSPDNVLVSNDGAVKLTDFGVARLGKAETTDPGRRHGKMPYMPPEVFYDGSFREPRCDVYSLGVVLEEMLSNRDPAASGIPPEPPPRPPTLDGIVRRARHRSPAQRTSSAADLRDQLDSFLRTECDGPVPATAIGTFARDLLWYVDSHPQEAPPDPTLATALLDEAALEF